jgi:hypothetical protein
MTTSGNIGAIWDSTSSGMSSTILACRGDQLGAAVRYERMNDPVESLALVLVAERDRGQRRAVQCTVGPQDVRAERVDELG